MAPSQDDSPRRRFRVALSFAGEQRAFVAEVAAALADRFGEAAILYDKFHEAEFGRHDLGFYLPELYHDQSDLIVVVVCPDYDAKEWCGLEWAAIFDLIKKRKDDEVMLCRFARAEVKGLYSTAGFVDLDDKTPDLAAVRILERLALNEGRAKDHYLRDGVVPPREPAAPSSPPRQLPPAASRFFGREEERGELVARLREGKNTAVSGFAGMGKTALAAAALAEVVGANAERLATSPFPDGLVYLDLYALQGQAAAAWTALANSLQGPSFLESRPARERATEACRGRRILVILEGGEEADGKEGRTTWPELRSVLSPENRWLLLTRPSVQTGAAETVRLRESLSPKEAGELLDWLTLRAPLAPSVRQSVLDLLDGHPLALSWAGSLLAAEEEPAEMLVQDWRAASLPGLRDPEDAEHTLQWLFGRSVRDLDKPTSQALAAAGLLAREPFPLEAIAAALEGVGSEAPVAMARAALKSLVQRGLLRIAEGSTWQFTHVLGYLFAGDEGGSDPALRERLGQWLHAAITSALEASRNGGEATSSLARLLEHAAALLRADFDQRLWIPLARDLLYRIAHRLEELGRLTLVNSALAAVEGWLNRLPATSAQEPQWLREWSILITDRGDVQLAQGDLAGALTSCRESLAVDRRLAEADPSNAGWQGNLSVSLERIADVQIAQGDLVGALTSYREALAVMRRLTEADPSNTVWQRELSVRIEKIGDVQLARGDFHGALRSYRESLAVKRRLAEDDPSNAGWQRDLGVSHGSVGRALRRLGDFAGAAVSFRESLTVFRRLAEADPANAGWQRDLSVNLTLLAGVHEKLGAREEALSLAEEGLAIDERLAALDPSNVMWQQDVKISRALVARLREPG